MRGEAAAGAAPVLVIVSEHPELFAAVHPRDREVHQWRPHLPDGAASARVGLFAGDPTRPETYAAVAGAGRETVALLDLRGHEQALAAVRAVRAVAPDTAFVVLCEGDAPELPDDAVARRVSWSDLLRLDLETELVRLDLRRRVRRLRAFADGASILPILLQDDPDPDGIASALAVRRLLRRRSSNAPIVSLGRITRPENRRMVELLRIGVTQVTAAELRRFDRLVAVDVQPVALEGAASRLAVIDHHPPEDHYAAEVADIRADYGATATILTEYLRADDERRIGRRVATALLYGVQTDTARLSRGVAPADIDAFAFLHARADHALLQRIARPACPAEAMRAFGRALAEVEADRDLAVAYLGPLPPEQAHVLADLADFCLSMEGAVWVAVGALVDGDLVITLRHQGGDPGAGALAHRLAGTAGTGGGHASMARVILPPEPASDLLGAPPARAPASALAAAVRRALERRD